MIRECQYADEMSHVPDEKKKVGQILGYASQYIRYETKVFY